MQRIITDSIELRVFIKKTPSRYKTSNEIGSDLRTRDGATGHSKTASIHLEDAYAYAHATKQFSLRENRG